MDQMKCADQLQQLKDVTKLKAEYKIERNALVKALTQPERYAGQRLWAFAHCSAFIRPRTDDPDSGSKDHFPGRRAGR